MPPGQEVVPVAFFSCCRSFR